MPAKKRYDGTLHIHVPKKIRAGVIQWAEQHDVNQSEATRKLLAEGLRAEGVQC